MNPLLIIYICSVPIGYIVACLLDLYATTYKKLTVRMLIVNVFFAIASLIPIFIAAIFIMDYIWKLPILNKVVFEINKNK
jgi:hypothetical protein